MMEWWKLVHQFQAISQDSQPRTMKYPPILGAADVVPLPLDFSTRFLVLNPHVFLSNVWCSPPAHPLRKHGMAPPNAAGKDAPQSLDRGAPVVIVKFTPEVQLYL